MKPTKKEAKKVVKKQDVTKKKESSDKDCCKNLKEEVRDLQGIVIGMGKRLDELTSLYKRVKNRMGL